MVMKKSTLISISSLIPFLSLISLTRADTKLGCFSAIPSDYTSQGTYTWQSSSYCAGLCSSYDYFALFNGNECYCGNSSPDTDDEVSSSQCSVDCVGYPSETCGSTSDYNIFAVANNVELSSAASSNTEEASSTDTQASTTTGSTNASAATQTSTTSANSTTDSNSSSSSATTTSHTSSVITSIVQESGTVVTSVIYVTPSSSTTSASSTSSSTSKSSSSSSSNKGAIIGGAVGGVIGGLIIIGAIVFFVCYRRRNSDDYDDYDDHTAMADDLAYKEALQSNKNPFASPEDNYMSTNNNNDKIMLGRRRLSDGSLADAADYDRKVLRVANPDDDLDY